MPAPTITTPVTFRQSAPMRTTISEPNVAAAYVQDQMDLSRYVQVIAGLRFDHFDLQYHNNRNGDNLRRIDNLVSPRAGIVFKPIARSRSTATTACRTCRAPEINSRR